jgi:hypothetical protein
MGQLLMFVIDQLDTPGTSALAHALRCDAPMTPSETKRANVLGLCGRPLTWSLVPCFERGDPPAIRAHPGV